MLNKDQAIARVWVRAGAEGVVITGRRQDALDETLLSLTKLNTGRTQTSAFSADVTKEDDAVKLFEQVQSKFGRSADVVFANAGLMLESKPLAEENISSWWRTHVCSGSALFGETPADHHVGDQRSWSSHHNCGLDQESTGPQKTNWYNHQHQHRPLRNDSIRNVCVRDLQACRAQIHGVCPNRYVLSCVTFPVTGR